MFLIDRWVEHRIGGFEALTGQSAAYLRDIYRASKPAFFKYLMFQTGMGQHRTAAPAEALAVASVAVMRQQDCGPRLQISLTLAENQGVSSKLLEAAAARDLAGLPDPLDTVFLFAEAVTRSDWNSAHYEQILRDHYGDAGMVDLAFAIASAAVYPTLKRALGHGNACTSVSIGGKVVPVHPMLEQAGREQPLAVLA